MALPITPRSRTLAALGVARGTYMDTINVRKWHVTFAIFLASWFLLFSIFICFYPKSLMGDNDFLSSFNVAASENSDQKNNDNNLLSDNGRALVWGASLGFGALIAFIYHFFYVQFF
tara:strand:- start:1498 stop:1848 length:351 start_codon:yes stop_codon:yes gene_type:complete